MGIATRAGSPEAFDAVCDLDGVFMFPDPNYHPPPISQRRVVPFIPCPVGLDLVAPPIGVGLRRYCMVRAAVPEAAVHLHDDTRGAQHDIGPAGHSRGVDAVPQPAAVEFLPDRELRARAAGLQLRHEARYRRA